MKHVAVLLSAMLVACEPPPPAGTTGDPSLEILFPPSGVDIPLVDDGAGILTLEFTLVVDINNFDFLPAFTTEIDEEGQGHFHYHINGTYLGASDAQYIDYVSAADEFTVGQQMSLLVTLTSNSHTNLDQFDGYDDTVEFTLAAPL